MTIIHMAARHIFSTSYMPRQIQIYHSNNNLGAESQCPFHK